MDALPTSVSDISGLNAKQQYGDINTNGAHDIQPNTRHVLPCPTLCVQVAYTVNRASCVAQRSASKRITTIIQNRLMFDGFASNIIAKWRIIKLLVHDLGAYMDKSISQLGAVLCGAILATVTLLDIDDPASVGVAGLIGFVLALAGIVGALMRAFDAALRDAEGSGR